jgi:hypothetical protein
MKICVIFRGENVRKRHSDRNRKYIDILMCWDNIKKTIYNDLLLNGHECDFAFVTYNSDILENIKVTIKPKHIEIHNQETQAKNFEDVISFVSQKKNEYDRFIILRCDIMYRKYITKWPKWNESGIFILNKDIHWPSQKLYSDVLFMVDSPFLDNFKNAFYFEKNDGYIHTLGKYLYINQIPFHLMYDTYYHMLQHPLCAIASLEEEPDLNIEYMGKTVLDVSQWN